MTFFINETLWSSTTWSYLNPFCIFLLAFCIRPLRSSFSLMGRVASEDWAVCTVRDVRADLMDTTVIFDFRSSSTKNGFSPPGGLVAGFEGLSLLLLVLLISECHPDVPPGRSILGKRLSARGVFWLLDGILSVGNHIVAC